jgi:hypothetical protein
MKNPYDNASIEDKADAIILMPYKNKGQFGFADLGCGCCSDGWNSDKEEALAILKAAKRLLTAKIKEIENE